MTSKLELVLSCQREVLQEPISFNSVAKGRNNIILTVIIKKIWQPIKSTQVYLKVQNTFNIWPTANHALRMFLN